MPLILDDEPATVQNYPYQLNLSPLPSKLDGSPISDIKIEEKDGFTLCKGITSYGLEKMRERANIGKMFFGSGSSKSNSRRSSIRRRSILSPPRDGDNYNGKNDDILSKDSKLESEIGISAKDLSPVQKLNNKTLFMTEKRELVEK